LETEISQLLKNNKAIDGILAVNEIYALTAIKAARKLGRQIPNDIQVIGFTDGVLSRHATPSLTTVRQHGQAMGEKAAELLIDKLENENEQIEEHYKTIIIETDLVERESTN
jgi:LacI family transcriptional regulator